MYLIINIIISPKYNRHGQQDVKNQLSMYLSTNLLSLTLLRQTLCLRMGTTEAELKGNLELNCTSGTATTEQRENMKPINYKQRCMIALLRW